MFSPNPNKVGSWKCEVLVRFVSGIVVYNNIIRAWLARYERIHMKDIKKTLGSLF